MINGNGLIGYEIHSYSGISAFRGWVWGVPFRIDKIINGNGLIGYEIHSYSEISEFRGWLGCPF